MDILFRHLLSIDSTNAYAKSRAYEIPEGSMLCFYAEEQTAGKGRWSRPWHSPPGANIYATFAFRLPAATPDLAALAQVLALSLAEVLRKEGLHPAIKWPNDVRLNGKKISGVLCETVFEGNQVLVIAGIGVNVNTPEDELASINPPASSLYAETGRSWDRDVLLKALGQRFSANADRLMKGGFSPFSRELDSLLAYKGEEVFCFDGAKEWRGICQGVASDGQLVLLLPGNERVHLSAGDVRSLRQP